MGYCLDPASDQFIAPVKMQAIREWVDGVLTVGEILREGGVLPDSDAAERQQEIRRMEHLTSGTVLSFAPHGITWADIQEGRPFGPDALRQLCSVGPVLLDLDVAAADMPELLAAVQPYGWVARGGEEERVGVKSYDDLDEIFEAL